MVGTFKSDHAGSWKTQSAHPCRRKLCHDLRIGMIVNEFRQYEQSPDTYRLIEGTSVVNVETEMDSSTPS